MRLFLPPHARFMPFPHQCTLTAHFPCEFSASSPQRVLTPPRARVTRATAELLSRSPARCASPHNCDISDSSPSTLSERNRCFHSFSTLLPLRRASEVESVPRVRDTKQLAVDSCPTAEIEEMGLPRIRQSVVACNRRPRVETAASLTTAVDPLRDSRLSRALGLPGDPADDLFGSV